MRDGAPSLKTKTASCREQHFPFITLFGKFSHFFIRRVVQVFSHSPTKCSNTLRECSMRVWYYPPVEPSRLLTTARVYGNRFNFDKRRRDLDNHAGSAAYLLRCILTSPNSALSEQPRNNPLKNYYLRS